MRHPYKKYVQIEMFSLFFAVFFGFVAIIRNYPLLIFMAIYCLSISFICETLILLVINQKTEATKQLIRAVALLIFTTYLVLKW